MCKSGPIFTAISLAASASANETQHDEEDVDNIKVQLQRSKDVLLRAELVTALLTADDHLSVKDQELAQNNKEQYVSKQEDTVCVYTGIMVVNLAVH